MGLSPWTRRDLLATFLAAPVAAASCRSGAEPPPLPPGELIGPSVEVGHRLRDGFRPEPPADGWVDMPVVIVGGGVAGLSAAWRLERGGLDRFALLELEPDLGGTSRAGHSDVVAYPWGAHYIPAPLKEDRALVALLDEMGVLEGRDAHGGPVVAEQFLCRDPEERVFHRGRWYEGLYLTAGASGEDLAQFETFRAATREWVAWRDGRGRRAFGLPIASGSDDAEVTALDRLSMADWLGARGLTSERLRWYVEYACRDDYGARLEQTSAWAGLFYFCSRVGGFDDEAQPLVTWPEGNGRLVAHLAGVAGERVRSGLAVTDVRLVGTTIEVVAYDVAADAAVGFRCDRAILATPSFLTERLVAPLRDGVGPRRDGVPYGAWMVANLHLRDRPRLRPGNFPMCWDNVLVESPSLGYVVATHQTEQDRGPTVLTYYYPLTDENARDGQQRLLSAGRDEWAEVALADLSVAHPDLRELTTRVDIMRWGHAMARPEPGTVWPPDRQRAAEPVGRVHFAHTDLSRVALFEEALYHGVRAAEEVLAASGRRVESLAL